MTKRPFALITFAFAAFAGINTGPEIGAKMPDFQALDQDGKARTLTSLLGPKGAIVVVYRSADW
jgi:hypothetical protein